MIRLTMSESAPPNWMPCDGRALPSAEFPELHALISTTFGDAGPGTFRLPVLTIAEGHAMVKVQYGAAEKGLAHKGMLTQVNYWIGNETPADWMECDGRLLPKSTYPGLAKLLGTRYGGDATHFALPLLPPVNGVRHLICIEGIDPSANASDDD